MEGFGLPLLEAQACGTRIACADATSLPEVAGPAGILFNGLDQPAIAAAITHLATMDDGDRRQREIAGQAWAADFTWSANAAQTAQIYQEILHPLTTS